MMQGEQERGSLVVGITGSIACGKTAVGNILADEGIAVLDADAVARDVVAPGTKAFEDMIDRFGSDMVRADGTLDRAKLADHVFADDTKRKELNAIVHPLVMKRVDAWIEEEKREQGDAAVIVPLLYEVGAEARFDKVICVSASREKVLERLADRGLTAEQAEARIQAQWPLAEKEKRADVTITNDGSLDDLKQNTLHIWNEIST